MSIWNRVAQFFAWGRNEQHKVIEKHAPTFADLQHLSVNQYLRDSLAEANVTISQMAFLLNSEPMIDMFNATDRDTRARLKTIKSPYAYINPKTLAPFVRDCPVGRWYSFPGSRTKWIPMSSMPEGRVIFSPSPVPGITV